LASLSKEEVAQGALVIDLGGGVTGAARFADGRLQEVHVIPVGGRHVTQDLAFGLSTGRAQAERLKTLFGSVSSRSGDARQRLEVPGIGDPEDPPAQIVSRARLTEIMQPRVEEIFQLVRARLAGGQRQASGGRLVLTGGSSQLEGIIELAEDVFEMPARLGRARPFVGRRQLEEATAGTTAAGLLAWTNRDDGGLTFQPTRAKPMITARLAKLGQWLRENF
jgi:cell division protein FtsA